MLKLSEAKTISDGEVSERLTPIDYYIVKHLLENKGKLVSKDILVKVSGVKNERSLDTHLWNLRHLNRVKIPIEVVPKKGVRLLEEKEPEQ